MRWLQVLVLVGVALVLASCSSVDDEASTSTTVDPTVIDRLDVDWPTPLVEDGDRLLYGGRLTGEIVEVPLTSDGFGSPEPVAEVEVDGAPDDQRGLLGLAVVDGAVYASWTRPEDGRLVVGRVTPEEHLVWLGPESAERANGGHLVATPEGRLLVGIGDLLDRSLVDDPEAPNGKLLLLDPDGSSEQRPEVVSGDWNNPFAFTYDDQGRLWVADNAGPRGAERFGRGDDPDVERFELAGPGEQLAPSALVDADGLALCGFLSRTLRRVDLAADGSPRLGEPLSAAGCSVGAVAVPGGRVVVAGESGLTLVEP